MCIPCKSTAFLRDRRRCSHHWKLIPSPATDIPGAVCPAMEREEAAAKGELPTTAERLPPTALGTPPEAVGVVPVAEVR